MRSERKQCVGRHRVLFLPGVFVTVAVATSGMFTAREGRFCSSPAEGAANEWLEPVPDEEYDKLE